MIIKTKLQRYVKDLEDNIVECEDCGHLIFKDKTEKVVELKKMVSFITSNFDTINKIYFCKQCAQQIDYDRIICFCGGRRYFKDNVEVSIDSKKLKSK